MNQPKLINRRRLPRIEASLTVEVKAECGLAFNAMTKDISQIGLLFVTDRPTFKQLTMHQRLAETSQPAEVDIKIALPMENGVIAEVCTHCRIFQLRRVSSDSYHIGLEYIELSESDLNKLSRYIEGVTARSERWQMCQ